MATQIDTAEREIVLVEDAHIRPMMGLEILESLPSRQIPYSLVDPYILVHEGVVPITPERASLDTKHEHRGFDNLWYTVSGSTSTGHSTGPGGAMERARLQTGSLLKLRTGRGVWHAEGISEDEIRWQRSIVTGLKTNASAPSAMAAGNNVTPQESSVATEGKAESRGVRPPGQIATAR